MVLETHRQIQVIEEGILNLLDLSGGAQRIATTPSYRHLSLAVIGAVGSLQDPVDGAGQLIERYRRAIIAEFGIDRVNGGGPEHGVDALVHFVTKRSIPRRWALFATPGIDDGAHPTDLILEMARRLERNKVRTTLELAARSHDIEAIENAFSEIPEVDSSLWRRMLDLTPINRVKADSMIQRWVSAVLFAPVDPVTSARLVEHAAATLRAGGLSSLSYRTVDRLIAADASDRRLAG